MMKAHRPSRVLHSMPAPGAETRYANQMAAVGSAEFEMLFFTWRSALIGAYDIFHMHWPEHLLGPERGVRAWVRWLGVRALFARLRRRRTPVVYTLHNHRPHDRAVSPRLERMYQELAELTRIEIHLVPEPERETSSAVVQIPHGSYREPFATYPKRTAQPGRVLTFGIIKRYKGITRLLDVFATVRDPSLSLRIVGEPADRTTVAAIDAASERDQRVTARYGFLPDADLVAEVSSAGLVVLPYLEMHSSGAVLVALSLDRPVLIPASPAAECLRNEAGAQWVRVFTPPLTADALRDAIAAPWPDGRPNLVSRSWSQVKAAHTHVYRMALESRSRETGEVSYRST